MNKIAKYLQTHLSGEVFDDAEVLEYFSTDASILKQQPTMVVYPRTTNDVRKVARFSWQLAEKGHKLPITARGSGTDFGGAAIGSGVVMVFPAHMNRILELDSQQKLVRLQPGVNFKSLQETLNTHGLFLPTFPASYKYSTIGGAIANNVAGEKSIKYGQICDWVEKLEVVLANGELIQTGRIGKREVEKKKGLTTLEGELYRIVDGLARDNEALLDEYYDKLDVSKDTIGYNLRDVVRRDGSIDLTQVFVGSQGTLGIITEAILKTTTFLPKTSLVVATIEKTADLTDIIDDVTALSPSAFEMIDGDFVQFVEKERNITPPKELVEGITSQSLMFFVEFNDQNTRLRERKAKKIGKMFETYTQRIVESSDMDEQDRLWALRGSVATYLNHSHGAKVALPVVEDAIVPIEKLGTLLGIADQLFEKYHSTPAIWGHAGDANVHIHPAFNLEKSTDRQAAFKLMEEYYKVVVQLGGSIAAEHNEGRLRVPFVKLQTGEQLLGVFTDLKNGFDSQGILNPGVKVGTDIKQLVSMMRKEYSLSHLSQHLPRT